MIVLTTKRRLERRVQELVEARLKAGSEWERIWLRAAEDRLGGDEVTDPYRQHVWVYVAIRKRAENVAQVPFRIYQGEDEVTQGPIAELFRRPSQGYSRYELWEATITYLDLRGWCLWYLAPKVGRQAGYSKLPAGIQVLNPDFCKPVKDAEGRLAGWMYSQIPLELSEVIRFRHFHPADDVLGLSPLEAARLSIESDYQAGKYGRAFFKNAATPGGVLETDQQLTDEQYKRLLLQWEARHGGAEKAHRIALLEGGLKYQQMSLSQRDMEFLEQRRYNREEILAIYGVPKALCGITDDLNYATHEGQRRVFWNDTIEPLLERLEEQLEAEFFPRYAPELRGLFDRSAVPELQEDISSKVQIAQALWQMGFTANEINERLELGFGTKPWRDKWWPPLSLVPVGEGSAPPPAEEEPKGLQPAAKAETGGHDERLRDLFLASQAAHERTIRSKVRRWLFEQRAKLLKLMNPKESKSLDDGWEEELAMIFSGEAERLVEFVSPGILSGLEEGYRLAATMGLDVSFQMSDPAVQAWLAQRANLLSVVSDDIFEEIRGLLRQGLDAGQSTEELAQAIRELYNELGDARSMTIARTESAGAINAGQLDAYRKSGVKKKRWLTARDEKVRPSHAAAAAQGAIPMEQAFVNGLVAPHQAGAPADEVINCRCTLVPVVED
jgi:HK97 family phage portal protein